MKTIEKKVLCVGDRMTDMIIDTRKCLSTKQATDILLNDNGSSENMVNKVIISGGGTTANTAVSIARLGEKAIFLGKIGKDPYGALAKNSLIEEGVDARWLIEDEERFTNVVILYIDGNGDRDSFVYPTSGAASSSLTIEEIPERIFDNIELLFTTGINLNEEPMCGTIFELAKQCRKKNIPVAFDISLRTTIYGWNNCMRNRYLAFMDLCDIVLGSGIDELSVVTGIKDPRKAAQSLVTEKRIVVCKSGEQGASVYALKEAYQMSAYPIDIQDTIGAGDTFNSGFLVAFCRGRNLQECLLWGCASAGYSIQFEGAGHGPTEKELTDFIAKYKDAVEINKVI
jgi:sugar/nucleoside kinase (ribokinase family)